MFGCLFRLLRFVVVLALFTLVGGAIYYYGKLHPEKAPWREGALAVKDKVATTALAAQVKAALALRESLKDLEVSVSAEKDVVTLRGKVPGPEVSKAVEEVASSVPGVRQVVNFLEIDARAGPSPDPRGSDDRSIGEKVDDEALELKIRAAFKLDKDLAEAGFEVRSMRRAVRLASNGASPAQREKAAAVAGSIEGVASVEVVSIGTPEVRD